MSSPEAALKSIRLALYPAILHFRQTRDCNRTLRSPRLLSIDFEEGGLLNLVTLTILRHCPGTSLRRLRFIQCDRTNSGNSMFNQLFRHAPRRGQPSTRKPGRPSRLNFAAAHCGLIVPLRNILRGSAPDKDAGDGRPSEVNCFATRQPGDAQAEKRSHLSGVFGRWPPSGSGQCAVSRSQVGGGWLQRLAGDGSSGGRVKVCTLGPGGIRTNWARRAVQNAPELLPEYEASVGSVLKLLSRSRAATYR